MTNHSRLIAVGVLVVSLLLASSSLAHAAPNEHGRPNPQETGCNEHNPTNCPTPIQPDGVNPICGNGQHTGNPHCDEATPEPTVEPTPAATPTPETVPTPDVTPTPPPDPLFPGEEPEFSYNPEFDIPEPDAASGPVVITDDAPPPAPFWPPTPAQPRPPAMPASAPGPAAMGNGGYLP